MSKTPTSRTISLTEFAKLSNSIDILTTAPTSNNPVSGNLKIVVLDAEPETYYNGYYYIITEE